VPHERLASRTQMKLQINGEERDFSGSPVPFSLAALVESLGMKSDRVAVELNRDIVPRDRWAATQLNDGDRLEIVHFVGGGSSLTHKQELS
jgi:sulfur carrier protein